MLGIIDKYPRGWRCQKDTTFQDTELRDHGICSIDDDDESWPMDTTEPWNLDKGHIEAGVYCEKRKER